MNNPNRGGKVHKRAKSGDISMNGHRQRTADETGKAAIRSPQGRAAIAVAEIESARSQDCHGRPALLALYSTSSSDGRPPEALREERSRMSSDRLHLRAETVDQRHEMGRRLH